MSRPVPPSITSPRAAAAVTVLLLAVVLQVSLLPHLAYRGVVADVVLLVVVAAGLRHGSEPAMVLGFAGGLLLDLLPPADHVAGRWALGLLLAGYVAGRVSGRGAQRWSLLLGTVAACSVVATSTFALTGLVLRDPLVGVPTLLETLLVALVTDVLLGALLVPLLLALDERLEPDRVLLS